MDDKDNFIEYFSTYDLTSMYPVSISLPSSMMLDTSFDIIQEDKTTFLLKNISLDQREMYKWLMLSNYDIDFEEIEYTIKLLTLRVRFNSAEGAVDFKLSWM